METVYEDFHATAPVCGANVTTIHTFTIICNIGDQHTILFIYAQRYAQSLDRHMHMHVHLLTRGLTHAIHIQACACTPRPYILLIMMKMHVRSDFFSLCPPLIPLPYMFKKSYSL